MPEMIAYCGIDCNACPALIATRTNDAALRAKTAAEWSKSFGHDFKPEQVNCAGCATLAGFHKNSPEAKARLDAVRARCGTASRA